MKFVNPLLRLTRLKIQNFKINFGLYSSCSPGFCSFNPFLISFLITFLTYSLYCILRSWRRICFSAAFWVCDGATGGILSKYSKSYRISPISFRDMVVVLGVVVDVDVVPSFSGGGVGLGFLVLSWQSYLDDANREAYSSRFQRLSFQSVF